MRRAWTLRAAIALPLVMVAACGRGGCAPLPVAYPSAERRPNAAHAHLSSEGVRFLEDHPVEVLGQILSGNALDVSPQCGSSVEVCCGSAPGECRLAFDVAPQPGDSPRLVITPVAGASRVDVAVRARIKTDPNPLPTKFSGIQCDLQIDSTKAGVPSVTINLPLNFVQDPSGSTRLEVGDVAVSGLESADMTLSGGFGCVIGDQFLAMATGTLTDVLTSAIADRIRETSCLECTDTAQCGAGGTCTNGFCLTPQATCEMRIGMAGRTPARALVSVADEGAGAMDGYAVAGGYAFTNRGSITLGVLGSARAADDLLAACVSDAPAPAVAALTIPNVAAMSAPDGGVVTFVIHEDLLNLSGWAAYRAGALCSRFGTGGPVPFGEAAIEGLFATARDAGLDGPARAFLRPVEPPVFAPGDGTYSPQGEVAVPALIATLPVELSIQEGLLVFRAKAHVALNLETDATGALVPVASTGGISFSDLVVAGSLDATQEELAAKAPAFLEPALSILAGSLSPVPLPTVVGMQVEVPRGAVNAVDGGFIAVYGGLAIPAAAPQPADATAALAELTVPPADAFTAAVLDPALRPSARLSLGGTAASGASIEWQVRLDQGLWSPWRGDPEVTLSSNALWLQARHLVEVRARETGRPETVDPTPAIVELLIDRMSPEIALQRSANTIQVAARDSVSPEDRLAVRHRVVGGEWQQLGASPTSFPIGQHAPQEYEVSAVDEAGNESIVPVPAFTEPSPQADAGSSSDPGSAQQVSCGCGASPRRASGALQAGAVAVWLWWRRRGKSRRR